MSGAIIAMMVREERKLVAIIAIVVSALAIGWIVMKTSG